MRNREAPSERLMESFWGLYSAWLEYGNGWLDAVGRWYEPPAARPVRCGPCEIPDPCWYPKRYEVCSSDCPGARHALRLVVENRSPVTRHVAFEGSGELPLAFDPAVLDVAPFESGETRVTVELPMHEDRTYDQAIRSRGCRIHRVRWRIHAGREARCECPSLCLIDGPDPIHHWYDHFYCPRPCASPQ